MTTTHNIKLVLFDLGGVVLPSPFPVIAKLEASLGVAPATIVRVIKQSGDDGAWARLERGELSAADFDEQFRRDCRRFAPGSPAVAGSALLAALAVDSLAAADVHPAVRRLIERLRARGVATAALTNVWKGAFSAASLAQLDALFDLVVQSCDVGSRKPEPRIYRTAVEQIRRRLPALACSDIVFLDDIGSNLKPAAALGMHTIHVAPDQPLDVSLAQLNAFLPHVHTPHSSL